MPAGPSNCALGFNVFCFQPLCTCSNLSLKVDGRQQGFNAKSVSVNNILDVFVDSHGQLRLLSLFPISLTTLWVSRDAVATSVSVSNMLDVLSGPTGPDNPTFVNFLAKSLNVLVGFHLAI